MLLAATGMRAVEALSCTIKDVDFKSNPLRLFVYGENTKTKTDRTIFLTNEVAKQLSTRLDYKHRTRGICHSSDNGKSITEYRIPERNLDELVFGVYQIHHNLQYLYVNLCVCLSIIITSCYIYIHIHYYQMLLCEYSLLNPATYPIQV
jgi:Phage integrase family